MKISRYKPQYKPGEFQVGDTVQYDEGACKKSGEDWFVRRDLGVGVVVSTEASGTQAIFGGKSRSCFTHLLVKV